MSEVIIFGGTTEGRQLAEFCAERNIRAAVCVVSDYGKQLLPHSPCLAVYRQAMTETEMAAVIQRESPRMVLDATHPYAAVVSESVMGACRDTGVKYIRIARAESLADGSRLERINDEGDGCEDGNREILWKETVEEAVEYLGTVEGTVFAATGSRELKKYTGLPDYAERLYVRVLPGSENLAVCESLGICGKHVIAMQGPFSREMNAAMLRHTGARYLVTKEAGAIGGFMEKVDAALECGVIPIVIGRPGKPEGISLEEGMAVLERECGKNGAVRIVPGDKNESAAAKAPAAHKKPPVKQLNLVGIGMGGAGQLTWEAADILRQSDVVLGAARMLQSVEAVTAGIRKVPVYLSRDVLSWLDSHGEYNKISVVYSGDTGFYSGARTLLEDLKRTDGSFPVQVRVYPGISTVSYLCSRLQTSWDDIYLASAHGRALDELELLEHHEKVFLLLGGEDAVKKLCRKLTGNGRSQTVVSVGERLSYPDERIVTGFAKDFTDCSFGSLTAVLLRRSS